MKKFLAAVLAVTAFGFGSTALAGEEEQQLTGEAVELDGKKAKAEKLEFLSPEVTPPADQMTAQAACGTWLADPDPSWPTNTSSYSNGAYEGTGTSCNGYGEFGYRYQCVEYVQRYFYNRWNVTPKIWYGNARDLCNTAPSTVTRLYSYTALKHGDAVVFNWGTYGHVGIIDYATGGGCYSMVDQNGGYGGRRQICYNSGILCALRAPGNR